jgi:hypothetical protein
MFVTSKSVDYVLSKIFKNDFKFHFLFASCEKFVFASNQFVHTYYR